MSTSDKRSACVPGNQSTRAPCGIVLFGHGSRDPQWARPLQRVRELLEAQSPGLAVRLAFLEFLAPALPDALDELAAMCDSVLILPMFMSQNGHVQRDVPVLLEQARVRHPHLSIELAPPIGESPQILAAIARHALDLASGRGRQTTD